MIRSDRSRYFDPEQESVFYYGLDLGQIRDYSALTLIERPPGLISEYHVRGLKRFPLGTSYPNIAETVTAVLKNSETQPNVLLIDNTGVGVAVADLFRAAKTTFWGISIHGGDQVNQDGKTVRVPKRDLISTLQVLFQSKRLKISKNLPEAQILIEELLDFQVKISLSGHDTYGCWREGSHDDLVLATSIACWAGEKKLLPYGYKWKSPNERKRRILYSDISMPDLHFKPASITSI
jgi:hypothetical protein